MGVVFEFLAATTDELLAAAPGWVVAEYGPYEERERVNAFTREKYTAWGYQLLSSAPKASANERIVDLLAKEKRAVFGDLSETLAALAARLGPDSAEERAKLGRQALVGPEDAESWVAEIPDALTASLGAQTPAQIEELAVALESDLDLSEPPVRLLTHLAEVASRAVSTRRRMFYYMTL